MQLCGDAHVSNFGGYASPDRKMVFDLSDFDETLPGPWEWDVKRLAASLAIAGRARAFDPGQRRDLVLAAMEAYRQAMREFAEMGNLQVWYARMTSADILDRWGPRGSKHSVRAFQQRVKQVTRKNSVSATSKLARRVDGEYQIISAPPLVVPLADLMDGQERATVERAAQGALRAHGRSLAGDRRALLEQFHPVDMARKVVGVGSVGTRAWVVLFLGADGDDPLVLQLKEARESVLAPYAGRSRFANQGQRVVEEQRLMQASSDIFLGWHRGPAVDGKARDFYVRQLWDGKALDRRGVTPWGSAAMSFSSHPSGSSRSSLRSFYTTGSSSCSSPGCESRVHLSWNSISSSSSSLSCSMENRARAGTRMRSPAIWILNGLSCSRASARRRSFATTFSVE